jgi:O-methyltransferase
MPMRDLIYRLTTRWPLNLRFFADNLLPIPALNAYYRATNPRIPDRNAYVPFFNPWRADREFLALHARIRSRTLVSAQSCWVLYALARQSCRLPGCYVEAGVYRGGTAALLYQAMAAAPDKTLHLFDSFEGMPETDPHRDLHRLGDFSDTSMEDVRRFVGERAVTYHKGLMPATFAGVKDEPIAFAHVDVDIYSSVMSCCEFIYPRLSAGGCMVFDDYGYPTCPGARQAVDEFFTGKPEIPLVLASGQAAVFKLPQAQPRDAGLRTHSPMQLHVASGPGPSDVSRESG